jgi:hypothetical protein
MGSEGLFTFPWPGPGNSEGPVEFEGLSEAGGSEPLASPRSEGPEEALLVVSAWPGPGDSEA